MAFVSIPNGVRIVHVGQVGNTDVVNTFGCQNGGTEVGADLGVLAKSHGDAWRANIVPKFHASYRHLSTFAYSLEDQSAAVGDAGYSSAASGTGTGNCAPVNCAVVVSLKTAKRGRTYQGRAYLGPFSTSALYSDGHFWDFGGILNSLQTGFAAYKAAVDPATGDNGKLAVCSKGSARYSIPPHIEPVTGFVIRPGIGTQRRRLT